MTAKFFKPTKHSKTDFDVNSQFIIDK